MFRTAATLRKSAPSAAGETGSAAPPVLAVLERELAHLVRALEAVQRRRVYPLDRALYLLLGLLERGGPQPVAVIADQLLLDNSTVTRQVDALEEQGLVGRAPNPRDRRSTLIRVTKAGQRVAAQMRDMRLGRIALLFADWSEAERLSLATDLTKLNAALRRSLAMPDHPVPVDVKKHK